MIAVWIYICLDINYLRICITKSVSNNCSKMGFVAEDLTEVSSLTELEDGNNFILFFTLI